ncbi:MAG TPA: ATP-binding protein [Lacunisphaera sp.]|nr:ATP-binding protein [Lacunisphaera sp.]
MPQPGHQVRLSFQLKVLLPVLAALVLLPTITFWIVNSYISRQMEEESRQSLNTAESVFQQLLELRSRDLLSRFRGAVNESSYRSLAPLVAAPESSARETIRKFLNDRLEAYGDDCEALLLVAQGSTAPTVARRGSAFSAEDFARATAGLTHLALQGDAGHGSLNLGGHSFLVVSVPVSTQENGAPVGALTVATRLGENSVQDLKAITGTDIVLLDNQTVTASTIRQPELRGELMALTGGAATGRRVLPVVLTKLHFFALTGSYPAAGSAPGFNYVLLSSYQQRLDELARTRITLLSVSLTGILISGLAVWFLIRRITQPLLVLRDHAEAVGRGDFSRRIDEVSNDECGAVAVAFNDMTENLQASRADLEKAVTTLKNTQAQLMQSEKLSAVGQFVAGVAHELNNPLTSVIGFSELLQATSNDTKQQEQLGHITRNALRCHKIVHSLLGFSRQHEPERKLVNLHEVADAVLEIVSYDMRVNNVSLVREYAPNLPPLLGDSHQLQQVVLNIVSNARQALETFRRDGCIIIRTGATDTHVSLRILDNGPGISAENLKKIFDPFFTTKPLGKGTGLGLSLSYGIVQEHRGSIRAESQPGVGTEFILEFPIAERKAVPLFRPDSVPPVPVQAPKPRLLHTLVIDDEESILRLIQEILHSEGHRVETAASGQAALDLILRHDYDVIVSDWKMPGLDGMNLYQELLGRKPEAARRMLFMTGDVIKDSFQNFLKMHARTCLPKPFALREFHSAVAGIIKPAA